MRRWKYLSLQRRLLIRVVIILIIGCLIWVMRGYPPLTEEGYLRRAERAHLLPDGDVLLRIDTNANGPDFLAADGGEYLELCRLPQNSIQATRSEGFYLYEKQGDMSVVPLPSQFYGTVLKPGYKQCTLLLFDERPEVQRVELSFEIDGDIYTSQSEREVGGIFRCDYFHEEELFYDHTLWGDYLPDIQNSIARLYDKNGTLIEETEVPAANLIT